MTSKRQLLDDGLDPFPPTQVTKAVTDLGQALSSLLMNGDVNLGTFLRRLMVPQRLATLAVVTGGTFDEVVLDDPGGVLAVNGVTGSTLGPLTEDAVGTPGTGEYGVIYDSDGVATVRLLPADAITAITVVAFQLPQAMADMLNADVP